MTNCTITLDVTGFGYTYLLQLDAMLGDFLEDGDNAAAADALHEWITENAREFTDDARANDDTLAADFFSEIAAEAEGGNDSENDAPANDDADDDAEDFGGSEYLAQIIADWRGRPENAELDNLLEQNAIDTNNDPTNLYRAGVFAGLVTALRTQISWASDDHNEIEAAIYKAYGVAW